MTKIIRDVVSEYESAVFDSTKGLLEGFNKCSVKDAIILLNKWLSITVADTSGTKAIGWKMPENDVCGETEGSSSFDPVFRCEVAYKLPNDEEKNLWVRVAPNVKALFETFLGEYYWGYGNILHFNAILGKYIHMCVDIDVCAMRVNGKDLKVGNKYAQYINGFPIFPVDVIENGIPLSQAFLGSESDVVFINWFKDEGKREGFEKICKGVSKGVMNVNFVFPDVGDEPLPFTYGLEKFKEKNDGFENDFPEELIKAIRGKRERERRVEFKDTDIPFALAYTLSMFVLAAENYCNAKNEIIRATPLNQGCLSVVFVPVRGYTKKSYQTGLLVTIKTPQTIEEYDHVVNRLTELSRIISRPLQILESQLVGRYRENQLLRVAHTQTAIAAIMSRNGSHNIGSHVLSALTHNVGTMPDDRVLYQYIQHRMDYIATATTGFPDWGVPTMFVGEIMRNFMMQHHLLDHIVESEGLHAYHFQGHNAYSGQNESNALRIQIEVDVGKDEKPNTYQFISYPDGDENGIADALRSDVCVAIPGGVAGHHAIYTIIENVIRNSAKHGWANSNHEKQKNLEITIRFRDDPSRNRVVFTIFDNTPQGENLDELVGDLNGKLDEKLISESSDGGLRQENWGLAEMRISASFFQQRTLGETGGIEKLAEDGDYIIRAVPVENNGNRYLGYEFHVAKPREMLFAIPYSEEWEEIKEGFSSQPDLVRKLGCVGIHVVFQHDAGADDYREFVTNQQSKEHERVMEWEYEYVILPQEPEDVRTGVYPFRMLVLSESKDGDFVWDKIPSYVDEPIGSKKIPSLHDLQDRLCELFGKVVRREDVDSNVCAIKKLIRLRWLLYFEKRTRPVALLEDGKLVDCGARDIRMLIDTDGQSSGQSGQGLISDYDVCAYIFEHVFSSLLDEIGESMALAKRLKEILKEQKITPLSCFKSVVNVGADSQTMRIERRKEVFGAAIDWMLDKVKAPKKFEADENLRNVLVDHLVGAFPTAHALLRKYAEKIDTLPENFCENTFSGGGERKDLSYSDDDGDFEGALTLRRRAFGDKFPPELGPQFTITYCRHGDIDDRDIYRSGLSGSQAGFSQFQHMEYASGEDYSTDRQLADFSHLVEDALSRVLVIDERVCKFLTSRRRIAKKLSWMNVWAVDTDMGKKFEKELGSLVADGGVHDMESCLRLDWDKFKECSQGKKVKDKKAFPSIFPCGKYDVLIIHQGIIDKLLGDQCTSENVAIFLTALKEQIPYVVITTGRGRPANTPRTARILPFPCVERYLFQEWPEKFLLINTIMNLLPCGGIKGA